MESTEQEKMSKLFKAQFETRRGDDADPVAKKKAEEELQKALREQVLKMKRADYDAFKDQMRDSLGAAFRADFDEYMGTFERNSRDISLMDARQSFADYVGFLKENHQARNPEAVAQKRDLEGAFLDNARACIKSMGNDALLQKALEAEYGELDEETRKGMTPHFVSRLKNLWNDPDFYNKKQEREQAGPAKEKEDEQKAVKGKTADIEEEVVKEGERGAVKTGEKDRKESGEDAQTGEEDERGSDEDAKTETGKSWLKAIEAAKVYAEEDFKHAPRPTHIQSIDEDGLGARLESGASFRVNPHKEDTMTMNTLREGVHLEDCLTMVAALEAKGYTAINVSKGSEEFRKAMYIAARIHGLTPKGFDQEKAQIWEQEVVAAKKSHDGTGPEYVPQQKPEPEKQSAQEEQAFVPQAQDEFIRVPKKFAANVTKQDAQKIAPEAVKDFMGVVYRFALENAGSNAKKLSKAQLDDVRKAWAKTGLTNVTVSDVLQAAPKVSQKVDNAAFRANVEAMVGSVVPKTINEVKPYEVADSLTPTKEQDKEIGQIVEKMTDAYKKQEKGSKKTAEERTTGIYAKLKGMAKAYSVSMDGLRNALKENTQFAQYAMAHPDFEEKIVNVSFAQRKTGEVSIYHQSQAKRDEMRAMEDLKTADRDTRRVEKNLEDAQKAEDTRQGKEMSAAARTRFNRIKSGAAR